MKIFLKLYIAFAMLFISGAVYAAPDIEQDPGDYTYFHSRHIINSTASYKNTFFEVKTGNSYVAERFDYTNPEKGECIILTKNGSDKTNNDVYFQTDIRKRSAFLPDDGSHYKYYCLKGDFCISAPNLQWQIAMLRDVSDGTYQEVCVVFKNGNLLFSSGSKVTILKENIITGTDIWHSIVVLYNMNNHTADIYLDNTCILTDIPFSDKVNEPSIMRCNVNYGKGVVKIRDWEFTGLKKPYEKKLVNGEYVPVINHSSVFPDDTSIKEYLNGKTVFHGEGNLFYKDGAKQAFEHNAEYTDTELYISSTDLNNILKSNIVFNAGRLQFIYGQKRYLLTKAPYEKNGIIYVPVSDMLSSMGINNGFSYYGKMVISSPDNDLPDFTYTPSWFDEQYHAQNGYPIHNFSDVEEISNYIFFERPSKEALLDSFNKKADNAEHPRLLINSSDAENIRNRRKSDYHFGTMSDKIIKNADAYLNAEIPQYKFEDKMRTKSNAEAITRRLMDLSFAYIATGDTKYADRAISDMLIISDFPDLNAAHIIDTGVWLKGLSIGYDWCYNEMDDVEKKKISHFIYEYGIKEVNRAYYSMLPSGGDTGFNEANWFPRWKSNYIAFVQGGLVPACLAVADIYPDECFDTLEKTFRSWEYMLYGFYDDGVWLEGKVYEKVVHHYTAYAMASILKCFDTDYNILQYKGFYESFRTAMALTSLTASFSYGDDSIRTAYGGVDPSWAFFGEYYNDDMIKAARGMSATGKFRNRYFSSSGTPEILDLIFYDNTISEASLVNLPKIIRAKGMELFSVSQDRFDKNALYFASSAGVSKHYHQHNDSGDFILCMDGEMWTYELGQGNYNTGSIYTRYSGRSEAHNTITLNPDEGFSQAENAYAPITEYGEGEGSAYVVYDMTELYAHHGAEEMKHGFYIGDGYSYLTVRDEMEFSKSTEGYWFMNSRAKLTKISDNTILMEQNGKAMYAAFTCEGTDVTASIDVMDSIPLPTSPNPEQLTSSNIKKIAIYFKGSGKINLTVRLSPVLQSADTTSISLWKSKVSAEKYTEPSKTQREAEKLIKTEDFENISQIPCTVSKNNSTVSEVSIKGTADNKYLYASSTRTTANNSVAACTLFFDSGLDAGEKFSAEYDFKLIPYNSNTMKGTDGSSDKYTEYNMGISDSLSNRGAYMTLHPYIDAEGEYSNRNASIFGNRLTPSVCFDADGINWYDWNRIRWVLCEDENGNQYGEVYINGSYYGKVGIRGTSAELTGICISINFNKEIYEGGFCLDNLSFYEGQCDTQSTYSLKTLNDTIPMFFKDFGDLSEKEYTSQIYPYYTLKNTADDVMVTSGTVKTVNDNGNTMLQFEDASVFMPNVIKFGEGEKSVISFNMSSADTMSAYISANDSNSLLTQIKQDSVIFGEKEYLYPINQNEVYNVQIVTEKNNGTAYSSLYINGTEIAYRKKLDAMQKVINQSFEPEYFNITFEGTGTLDRVLSYLTRGNNEPDIDMTKVSTQINNNILTVKINQQDLKKQIQPTLYAAVYKNEILQSINISEMYMENGEYVADVPYLHTAGSETKLYMLHKDTLFPLSAVRMIFNEKN